MSDAVQQEVRCPSCRRLIPADLFGSEHESVCPHCNVRVAATPQSVGAVAPSRAPALQHVVLTGIDIPFLDLAGFLVKLSLAAIPAGIIIAALWFLAAAVLVGAASAI